MTTPRVRAVNVAEMLSQTARRLPDATAVVYGGTRWTWRELDEGAGRVCAALRRAGARTGDCVLLHGHNHPEYIQALYGAWRAGAAVAPTNVRLTPADVTVIADVCRPVAMIASSGTEAHVDAVRATTGLPAGTLWIGDHQGPDAVAALPAAADGEAATARVEAGAHAWYFFTSGTSGSPKAAILTHDQLGFVTTNHAADLMPGLSEADVSLAVAPLSHGAGVHLLPQVARGAATVIPTSPGLRPEEVWELVERERVTNMFTVPTILKTLAEHPAAGTVDHSSLRHVVYAGAPMLNADRDTALDALGPVLVQYYGLGEVTGNITVLPPQDHRRPQPDGVDVGTCGRPRTGMQIAVVDSDGTELGPGGIGEICVAGPAVCAGYLGNEAATAAAFDGGWFHTGDLGMIDGHGYLYITGRASDMYISGGSNIHPRDIEEKLVAHPAVAEAAVLGMPHPRWGEIGVAIWVPRPGADADEAELLSWLEPRLARYKLPKQLIRWSELPKSGYGKVVKRTIREELTSSGWTAPA
ncbi:MULTISPECIES: AMP-binding protein [Pseudonocardia]|uniref:Long-chain-fatty-acid--CoA ligase n=2 Tax=Pseudonocardia TaxID=1847 RepID=A0A1Y2MM31_PSEAH|nr:MULTISPECIES: AMP-binding protein [Pseudonocardia]OSY36290.1 Long-chain-fatty-acid--CoA ligase [Pseudonocardia autotrophica]TDN73095.1 acyl-CoA synthetase (AMP-forming)/AMP-acid ligase II [Pseudonocardia autotrophica]BBG03815.1 acyl-CoA synthetase [Pseudonocardia autotrophica]GEC26577.1 acyl-CoA synthetase [Pseudonocardia saturnea]